MSRSLYADYRDSLRSPEFWAYSSWLDIATRHRRTRLGFLWFLVPTTVFLLVLGNVYAELMGYAREQYLPYLGVGFVIWRFMLQIVNESVGTMSSHKAFIMDGRTRLTDFMLRCYSKALYMLLFGLLVVLGILAWSPAMHVYNLLTIALSLPLLMLNLSWISVCLALVGARFRDAHEVMGTVLIVGFLVTPVLWTVERFPPDTLRGALVRLNPAFHMIETVRAPILGHLPEATSIVFVLVLALVGWPISAFLYRRYARYVPIWV